MEDGQRIKSVPTRGHGGPLEPRRQTSALPIPSAVHFVWLGKEFPFLNALAVLSAGLRGGFTRVVLHCDSDLSGTPYWAALKRLPSFEAQRIDLDSLARAAGERPDRVHALYSNMTSAAARSDVLRVLALHAQGGVYLDIDTVTIASFAELRAHEAFVGQEYICFPDWTMRTPSVADRGRAYALATLRLALRALPDGHERFRTVAPWYALAVNNAVLAAAPGHSFTSAYLAAMLAERPEIARRRFAIGPDMLARITRDTSVEGVTLVGPDVFYPLPPVISERWWSVQSAPNLETAITGETVSVHWYASVRSRDLAAQVNPSYVRAHRERQLFSKLAEPFLEAF